MKMKHTIIALAATATLSGAAIAATKADYEKAAEAAKAAQKAAAVVKGEWRDTGKLLEKSAKAAEEGDYAKAIELAKAAESQGKNGEQQAKSQVGVGNPGYLYN